MVDRQSHAIRLLSVSPNCLDNRLHCDSSHLEREREKSILLRLGSNFAALISAFRLHLSRSLSLAS